MLLLSQTILPGIAYVLTILTSLRAGSRALYLLQNDGTIGLMDGPLILGPNDTIKKPDATENENDSDNISPLWRSSFALQSGIRHSVRESANSKERRNRRPNGSDDFTSIISTDMTLPGEENATAHVSCFAPRVFSDLRRDCFGVADDQFIRSMTGPFVSFQSNSKGAARTGGFFFFSRDGAYMAKTIKEGEAKKMLSMLLPYYQYMKRNSRRTLLTRFFGLYKVKLTRQITFEAKDRTLGQMLFHRKKKEVEEEHYFLVMNSVFPAEGSKFISERFDLKGSTVGRECSLEEKETKGTQAIFKDLDLTREFTSSNRHDVGLHIGVRAKSDLLSQLRKDVQFLADSNVMDYSLLVGVVHMGTNGICSKTPPGPTKPMGTSTLSTLTSPLRILASPPIHIAKSLITLSARTLSTLFTLPLPYYGAGFPIVNGGEHSSLHGKRLGKRAIYYLGLIDFLQPWEMKKVLEREFKGAMGYDVGQISCVDPKTFAARFMTFMDVHLN